MNPPIPGIQRVCKSLAESHGDLALAGLFKQENGRDEWDFVIAASWLKGSLSDYELIVRQMKRYLSVDEQSRIARIVVLPSSRPAAMKFQGGVGSPSAIGVMRDFTFNGEPVAEGHIIESLAARLAAKGLRRRPKARSSIKPISHPTRRIHMPRQRGQRNPTA